MSSEIAAESAEASKPQPDKVIPKKAPTRPKWEVDAHSRVRAAITKYMKPLQELAARDANEGDTRLLVTDFLCDALGYDKYSNLTTEYQVKGEFADYGIRIDQQVVAFIEVKRVKTQLNNRHLRQVEMYAVNEGVEWMILTNGADWRVYHLGAGLPVTIDLALDVNLLGDGTPAAKTAKLFYLTIESLKRRQIDEVWKAKMATSPSSLSAVLQMPSVIEAIRKELWRKTSHRVEAKEIAALLTTLTQPPTK